jgi:gamma-glutamylputrescine synthase
VKRYLEYPNTQYVDVLLTDLNGCFRGKRIPVAGLSKLEKGCYFPASVFAMDILGNVVEEAVWARRWANRIAPACRCRAP